jgi:hypothetical protein
MHTKDDCEGQDDCLSSVIYEDMIKGLQMRLTVSEFRGKFYLGLRKWIINLDEDWLPTKQGFSWPYSLETTSTLFAALTNVLSDAEVLHEVLQKLHYEFELEVDLEDITHPRFIAGYEAGFKEGKLNKDD